MVWFKVDDQFAFHPKALAAGNAALGLWVRAGSWCGNNLTNGALPANMIPTLGAQRRDAKRLVTAGLWCETPTGYQFIDWEQWQPTKQQVRDEREATRVRVAEWRERQRNAVTTPVTNGVSTPAPSPTRPEPVLPTEVPAKAKKPSVSSRGTRLPEDWAPSLDLVGWVRENCPNVDGREQTARFRDFWISKAGQGATKVDWPATYRNWMREAQERAPSRPAPERARAPGISTGTQRAMAAVTAAQQIKDARNQLQIGNS